MDIRCKRIYEHPAPLDGHRVLVDRLWPRGIRRTEAQLELWLPEIAPSNELRRWFAHEPQRFDEFTQRYRLELAGQTERLGQLRALAKTDTLTLLYAARDEQRNNACVLADQLRSPEYRK